MAARESTLGLETFAFGLVGFVRALKKDEVLQRVGAEAIDHQAE